MSDEVATPPRVAYSVGRRIGPAVVRNRLRRRLRAIVADFTAQLAPGAYLISAGPRAAQMSFADLRSAVGGALDRMRTAVSRTGGDP
jgi:ribonuclease P protein component